LHSSQIQIQAWVRVFDLTRFEIPWFAYADLFCRFRQNPFGLPEPWFSQDSGLIQFFLTNPEQWRLSAPHSGGVV